MMIALDTAGKIDGIYIYMLYQSGPDLFVPKGHFSLGNHGMSVEKVRSHGES